MKKIIICCICFLSFSFFCGCGIDEIASKIDDQVQKVNETLDEHVQGVKNGYPLAYPNITYGQAFDNFFSDPAWEYFEAESGEDVVEFTGGCVYQDTEVDARLQFIISEDGSTFEQGALSFNDVPQSDIITSALICRAFEDYAETYGINVEESDDSNVMGPGTEAEIGSYDNDTQEQNADVSDEENYDESYDDYQQDYDEGYDDYQQDYDEDYEEYQQDYDEYYENLASQYIFQDSSIRLLEKQEVKELSKEECRLAKNEIYARHGRLFQDESLQEYFDSLDWYVGYIEPEDFDESVFNEIEKKNIQLLAKYEKK